MATEQEREAERVRAAYARRAALGLDDRYAYWQPANLLIYQARERALVETLRGANSLPLDEREILDIGCGDGAVLQDLLRYGARPERLHGVDLLPERIERSRARLPAAHAGVGDAQALRYEDGRFDIVLGFTLLSSVTDEAARRRVAAEMARVTKPGGLVVLYDFWINPFNRDARPLRRREVRALFPGHECTFRATTVAPPLVRALAPLPGGRLACSVLEVIPFVQTHYIAAVRI